MEKGQSEGLREAVNELKEVVPGESLCQIIEIVLEDVPNKVAQLKIGCANGDLGAVEQVAHSMKGNVAPLRMEAIMEDCTRLEAMSATMLQVEGSVVVARIEDAFDGIRGELGVLLQETRNP